MIAILIFIGISVLIAGSGNTDRSHRYRRKIDALDAEIERNLLDDDYRHEAGLDGEF